MATLILSTVGGIVGGPIGSAIGAVIGNVFDREVLLKPKAREGPRLTELQLQTSSYGTPVCVISAWLSWFVEPVGGLGHTL